MVICRLGIRIYSDLFCDICRLNDHELVWKYVDWALDKDQELSIKVSRSLSLNAFLNFFVCLVPLLTQGTHLCQKQGCAATKITTFIQLPDV